MCAAANRASPRTGRGTESPVATMSSSSSTVSASSPCSARSRTRASAEPGLRDGLVLLHDALVGQHAAGQPLGVELRDALGAAECGHRGQQRQRGHHRPAVGRRVVQPGAGRGAAVDVGDPDEPVLGHERIGDDDVVGAGGPHAVGVPDVDDGEVGGGQQGQRRVDPVVGPAQRADDEPVAVP